MSVERSYARHLPPPSVANGLGTPPCPDERCSALRRAYRRALADLEAALAERDALRDRKIREAAEWADADVLALGLDGLRLTPVLRRALAELLPVGSVHTSADLQRRLYGGYAARASIGTLIWRLRLALGGGPFTIRGGRGSGAYRLEAATDAELAAGRYVTRPQRGHRCRITPERARAVLAQPDAPRDALKRDLHMGSDTVRAIRDGTHPVLREMEAAP
jgi:hypothetical protein